MPVFLSSILFTPATSLPPSAHTPFLQLSLLSIHFRAPRICPAVNGCVGVCGFQGVSGPGPSPSLTLSPFPVELLIQASPAVRRDEKPLRKLGENTREGREC